VEGGARGRTVLIESRSRYIIFVNKRTWSESYLIGAAAAASNRPALMNNSLLLSLLTAFTIPSRAVQLA
jgi:hypothetical protein